MSRYTILEDTTDERKNRVLRPLVNDEGKEVLVAGLAQAKQVITGALTRGIGGFESSTRFYLVSLPEHAIDAHRRPTVEITFGDEPTIFDG